MRKGFSTRAVVIVSIILGIVLLGIFYRGLTGYVVLGSIEANRAFSSAKYVPGESLDVSIQLVDSGLDSIALGVVENVPTGWEIRSVSHKGIVKGNKIEWLLVPPKFEALSYTVVPVESGDVTFSGVWMSEELIESNILGSIQIGSGNPIQICGNGVIEAGEQCDDGNVVSGDGCSVSCLIEEVVPAVCTSANALKDSMDDLSGFSCTGSSCPTAVAGRVGGAMRFDGNDYLESSSTASAITGTDGTYSFWAKFDSTSLNDGQARVILGLGNPEGNSNFIDVRKINSNELVFRYRRTGTDIEVKRNGGLSGLDSWHHYVAVWNSNQVKLYIDGVLTGSSTITTDAITRLTQFRIGSRGFQTSGQYFKGDIDEVNVWNRALSETEVGELYGVCY